MAAPTTAWTVESSSKATRLQPPLGNQTWINPKISISLKCYMSRHELTTQPAYGLEIVPCAGLPGAGDSASPSTVSGLPTHSQTCLEWLGLALESLHVRPLKSRTSRYGARNRMHHRYQHHRKIVRNNDDNMMIMAGKVWDSYRDLQNLPDTWSGQGMNECLESSTEAGRRMMEKLRWRPRWFQKSWQHREKVCTHLTKERTPHWTP